MTFGIIFTSRTLYTTFKPHCLTIKCYCTPEIKYHLFNQTSLITSTTVYITINRQLLVKVKMQKVGI